MPAARPPQPGAAPPAPSTRLQLTVWVDAGQVWHARAEWGDRFQREFDNPFELARFVARLPEPPPRGPGGLR